MGDGALATHFAYRPVNRPTDSRQGNSTVRISGGSYSYLIFSLAEPHSMQMLLTDGLRELRKKSTSVACSATFLCEV